MFREKKEVKENDSNAVCVMIVMTSFLPFVE